MQRKIRPDPLIPDHEVLRKIGGGAYGEVWLARGVTGAMRAVKVVYREDFSDERTFEREFEGILRFEPISRNHQGFVNILHVGRSDDQKQFYYYVMELGDDAYEQGEINPVEYEPRTLRSDMKQAGGSPLATDFCIETGFRLAEALQELHECGLTHRDVKPSNVIFVDGKAKLADIGLVAGKDQRTFVGTEGFVPPEGPGSEQADIYSLGKVLYEMATGMDRLQFPELPDGGPGDDARRKWIRLNRLICDICEPRLAKRKISTGRELADALGRLKEGRKVRKKVPAYVHLILPVLLLLAGIGTQFWIEKEWGTYIIEGNREPLPPRFVMVKVLTSPEGAAVYDGIGDLLDYTPATLTGIEIGTDLELHIKASGYRELVVQREVVDNGQGIMLINKKLSLFSPPVVDEVWSDALGNLYFPAEKRHRSSEHVSEEDWNLFNQETGNQWKAIPFKHGGRKIVAVSEERANEFAAWLEEKCVKEGYLPDFDEEQPDRNRELVADYDLKFEARKLPATAKKNGKILRPFFCLVRPIVYGSLKIDSTPPGAYVYLNGVPVGVTPFDDDMVALGDTEISLELGGMKTLIDNVFLSGPEPVERNYVLEPNKSFVEGLSWSNSLEMKLEPLSDDLSVSVWETRSGDFHKFLKATGRAQGDIVIDTDPKVPVEGVSRADCEAFCEWLTKEERDNPNLELNRIKKPFRYRLPTDKEWSQMAALIEKRETLLEREQENSGVYPWGQGFPPPDRSGNFADASAVQFLENSKIIDDYNDGFPRLAPVGSFPPNVMGIYDLGGNVKEWVSDDYAIATEVFGVLRGGGWNTHGDLKLQLRFRNPVSDVGKQGEPAYGFRVVLAKDPEQTSKPEEEISDGGN